MPTVRTVIDRLGVITPWGKAAGWDPVGLQVGDPDAVVERIAVCHDLTPAVLDAAIDRDVDLLVAYHPLLFDPVRRLVAGSGPAGTAFHAARHGVAVIVVHTAFDVAAGGTADALADALGLGDLRGFEPLWGPDSSKIVTFVPASGVDAVVDAMTAAGAGTIGAYTGCSFRVEGTGAFTAGPGTSPTVGRPGATTETPETRVEMVVPTSRTAAVVAALVRAHPYEEPAFDVLARTGDAGFVGRVGTWSGRLDDLAALAEARLGGIVRRAGAGDREVGTVAVVPGSGASAIRSAVVAGADVLVTGDVKHHDARAALDMGLAIVDPGHAATERPGVARLYAAVAAEWDDTIDLTGEDADPWTR